jgi:hypothetical protein
VSMQGWTLPPYLLVKVRVTTASIEAEGELTLSRVWKRISREI